MRRVSGEICNAIMRLCDSSIKLVRHEFVRFVREQTSRATTESPQSCRSLTAPPLSPGLLLLLLLPICLLSMPRLGLDRSIASSSFFFSLILIFLSYFLVIPTPVTLPHPLNPTHRIPPFVLLYSPLPPPPTTSQPNLIFSPALFSPPHDSHDSHDSHDTTTTTTTTTATTRASFPHLSPCYDNSLQFLPSFPFSRVLEATTVHVHCMHTLPIQFIRTLS